MAQDDMERLEELQAERQRAVASLKQIRKEERRIRPEGQGPNGRHAPSGSSRPVPWWRPLWASSSTPTPGARP
jgi:hypothetical protein